jgi:hypothetical protein
MNNSSHLLTSLAPWAALAVTLLVWLLNRGVRQSERRDAQSIILETHYLAAHQATLAEQRQLLAAEKAEHALLKRRFAALQSDHLALHSAANEVILKYNLVRNLKPGDPACPPLRVIPPVQVESGRSASSACHD